MVNQREVRVDTVSYVEALKGAMRQDPDVILLRLSAYQGMVLHDAFGDMPIVGKPQCHIVPLAKEQNQIAMSTGCTLSRIRTGMSPDEMTCTIPASRFAEVVEKLET